MLENTPIRVLITGNYPLLCAGIHTTLDAVDDIHVVGEATKWQDMQILCQKQCPDILLVDLQMLEAPGLMNMHQPEYYQEKLKTLCDNTGIIVLTDTIHIDQLQTLISSGIGGYILKNENTNVIGHAIRSVAFGGTWFSRPVIDMLVQQKNTKLPEPTGNLNAMDKRLLEMIAYGWKSALIAHELHLAEQTVRNYISRLYVELNVHSRVEATIWAHNHGITTSPRQINSRAS
jgi:DNA-binding NarL/FixJ family response regulator